MITKTTVRRIASLARLALTAEEEEKFTGELSSILGFVEKLNEADTAGVLPMTGGTAREHVMREDVPADADLEGKSADLLAAVPERAGDLVKVKSVF